MCQLCKRMIINYALIKLETSPSFFVDRERRTFSVFTRCSILCRWSLGGSTSLSPRSGIKDNFRLRRASQSCCYNGNGNFTISKTHCRVPHCRRRIWRSSGKIWLVRWTSMIICVFSYEEPCFNVEMLMLNAVIASRCDPACVGVELDSTEHVKAYSRWSKVAFLYTFAKRSYVFGNIVHL